MKRIVFLMIATALCVCRQADAQPNNVDLSRSAPLPQGQPASAPARSLVNSPSISLDYRVDRVGPSGIGKVEIWITADQGTSWRRLSEETTRKSPFQINLPGEGMFGVRLVAVNGNGFGGNAPKRGDEANFWVEVDTTAPLVQLGNLDAYTDGANLTICWTAQDRNHGATPISLYYRSEGDQTWQLIARNCKNTGQYRWQFPRDKGDRFYLRIESTDDAGNTSHADTPTPIVLDMLEPQLIVVGVTVSGNQPQQVQRAFSSPAPQQFVPQQPVQHQPMPQQPIQQQPMPQQQGPPRAALPVSSTSSAPLQQITPTSVDLQSLPPTPYDK